MVVAVVLALLAQGCRTATRGAPGGLLGHADIPLLVDNHASGDLVVYVQHDGVVSRLERVDAAHATQLTIPGRFVGASGDLRLIGEPVGVRSGFADRLTSPVVNVLAGQSLVWTIESQFQRAVLEIR
ncbi:MAG: hypothetical protein ACHQQ3_10395 [Gemmatimonadales bacterium]